MNTTRTFTIPTRGTDLYPSFSCPSCHAKNILFAMSRQVRRKSHLVPIEDLSQTVSANYGIICPKCKARLMLVEEVPNNQSLKQNKQILT